MATVVCRKGVELRFYDEIPVLEEAVAGCLEKKAKILLASLGSIFAKYNLYNDFGLTLVHKHFELNANEILVESFNENKTISAAIPWNFTASDSVAEPSDPDLCSSLRLESKSLIIAQTWGFSESGNLKSFEYYSTDEPMLEPPTAFSLELFCKLKEFGLERLIGLRRIENRRGIFSWETTPPGSRANVTRFGPKPEDLSLENMVPVVWYFDQYGKLQESNWCMLHSGSVCKNH